jgi:hypothetical protein
MTRKHLKFPARRPIIEWRRESAWHRLWPLALLTLPAAALAQLQLATGGGVDYEYNSNVFDLQHGYTVPGVNTPPYGDSITTYGGKVDAAYVWSQQEVRATVTGNEHLYDRFSLLNHSDYGLDGLWRWKWRPDLDGLFSVTRDRTMVDLYTLTNIQLALETVQRETGRIGLQVMPDWRVEASGYTDHYQEPLVSAPDLGLTEGSGQAAIKYVHFASITAGLSAGYTHGDFSGTTTAIAPRYHQSDFALTATDVVTDLSTFAGRIGYTSRIADIGSGSANNASGLSGELDYKRALTGKTTLGLLLSRTVIPYLSTAGSQIANIADLKLNWQATNKIGLAFDYNYTRAQLPGQGGAVDGALNGSNRIDRFNYVGLSASYDPVVWLALKPYAHFQDRTSTNFAGGNFNATAVGVDFSVLWQRGTPPAPNPFQVQGP